MVWNGRLVCAVDWADCVAADVGPDSSVWLDTTGTAKFGYMPKHGGYTPATVSTANAGKLPPAPKGGTGASRVAKPAGKRTVS